MNMGLALIFSLVCAVICGFIAESKGRNALGWGVLGFFITWIAIIIVLVIGDLNEPTVVYRDREIIVPAKPIVKEEPSVQLKNHTVGPSEVLQVEGIKLFERVDHDAISLRVKVGEKDIKCLKLDVEIIDVFGESIKVEKLIINFDEPSSRQWQYSQETRIVVAQQLSVEHAKYVLVQPAHIIWADDSVEACTEPWKVMDEEELNNAQSVGDGLIVRINECENINEVKEVVEAYEQLLQPKVLSRLTERIDKDIYIKRMYGGKDDTQKIQKYIQIVEEEL